LFILPYFSHSKLLCCLICVLKLLYLKKSLSLVIIMFLEKVCNLFALESTAKEKKKKGFGQQVNKIKSCNVIKKAEVKHVQIKGGG
jgi:hypothetical protein